MKTTKTAAREDPDIQVQDVIDQAEASSSAETLLTEFDNELIGAVEGNNDKDLEAILAKRKVDINCVNASGQTPLQIAVNLRSTKVIQILLQNGADIGNSLLQAVANESLDCVKILLEFYENRFIPVKSLNSQCSLLQEENNEDYHVTPLILAAKNNSYDIVKFLMSKGYVIDDKALHSRSCDCPDCESEGRLGCSLRRLNVYRGLSSPVYLSLSHLMKPKQSSNFDNKILKDPILQAFVLNKELLSLAEVEYEFKSEYMSLSDQCEDFAVSLLNQCRNMSEIQQFMDAPGLEDIKYIRIKGSNELTKKLSVLNFAIKNNNKKFVAHSFSQMMLNSVVYRGMRSWESFGAVFKITLGSLYTLLLPLWALLYIVSPQNDLSQKLKSPILKFVGHSGSFLLFLVFLSLSSVQDLIDVDPLRSSLIDWLLAFWVAGITFQEAKEFFRQGKQRYFSQFWNIVTLAMLMFFFISGGFWIAGYAIEERPQGLLATFVKNALATAKIQSPSYKLILISNSFFAMAFLLAFLHLTNYFQVNSVMGPLQLSLVKMMKDILKFLLLFSFIYAAFTLALRKVYSQFVWATRKFGNSTTSENGFSSMYGSMRLTFWSVFDKTGLSEFVTDDAFPTKITQNTGEVLFALFNIATILVAVNMLIAMMSNSFQFIEDNSDVHWKFSRTRMWIQFIDKGSVLPPPFNMIPTLHDLVHFVKCIKRHIQQCKPSTQPGNNVSQAFTSTSNILKRDRLINHLIQRHFHQLEKDRNSNVNAKPLNRHNQQDPNFSCKSFSKVHNEAGSRKWQVFTS